MQRDTTDETAGFECEQRCQGLKLSRGRVLTKEKKEKKTGEIFLVAIGSVVTARICILTRKALA